MTQREKEGRRAGRLGAVPPPSLARDLHPPTSAARPRPRRLVRPRTSATSRSRCSCRTCWCSPARLPRADDDAAHERRARQYRRGRTGAARARRKYGVVGVGEPTGKAFAITGMVEKPRGTSAVQPVHHRPLHPAAGDLRRSGGAGPRRRRRDPAHRRHDRADGNTAVLRPEFDGRSFDCGSKIGFFAANVSYALPRNDIAPGFRAEIKKILGELNGEAE